jgi:hypothetical protein
VNAFVIHAAQPVIADTGPPFVGPGQAALEAMLREFQPT